MKKRNVIAHTLALFSMAAALGACASTTTSRESTGEYIDDSVITAKVKSMLATNDLIKSFQISVTTYQGTVQLSGFVNSRETSDKAAGIAETVKGVKTIKNDLIVK